MKKIVEIDCCWICPHHEYKMAYPYCGKIRKAFPVGFDGEKSIPNWCPLQDASQPGVEVGRADGEDCPLDNFVCYKCGERHETCFCE